VTIIVGQAVNERTVAMFFSSENGHYDAPNSRKGEVKYF
jgi:hypothetical protein